jgi:hypothetical protein
VRNEDLFFLGSFLSEVFGLAVVVSRFLGLVIDDRLFGLDGLGSLTRLTHRGTRRRLGLVELGGLLGHI